MLHDALIAAAADLWAGGSVDTESEYLRGQVELICNVQGLSTDENREKFTAEVVAKAAEMTERARMGNYVPRQP